MKTKKKLKNRLPAPKPTKPSPQTNNGKPTKPSPASSAAAGSSKPPKASGNTPPTPGGALAVQTETPNGSALKKYYQYHFFPDSSMETDKANLDYPAACAKDLATRYYDNVGELLLAVNAKFVGVRQVRQVDLRWVTNTFHMALIVTFEDGEPKTLGRFEPSSDQWYTNEKDGTRTKYVAPKMPAAPKPPDPALLKATEAKADEFTAADLPPPAKPPKPKVVIASVEWKKVTSKKTGKPKKVPTIFGHSPAAIMRWMGWDAWLFPDAVTVFVGLGLGDDLTKEVLEKNLSYGRKGNSAPDRPIPTLAPEEEDALLRIVENAKKKSGKKK